MTPPLDKPKKRHRPLRFALVLTGACALIVSVPLVGARLLAGSKWDEPDIMPVASAREKGAYLEEMQWSRDGKQVRFFASSYADRNRTRGTLTRIERAWPQLDEISREDVVRGDWFALSQFLALKAGEKEWRSAQDWFEPTRERGDGLLLSLDEGRRVFVRKVPAGPIFRRVGRRLRLARGPRVIRSWPVPDEKPKRQPDDFAMLSSDGKLAMVVTRLWSLSSRVLQAHEARSLEDVLGLQVESVSRYEYECRAWHVNSGRFAFTKYLRRPLGGRDAQGRIWMASLTSGRPVLFDGRGLWFALMPIVLPRDADEQLRVARQRFVESFGEIGERSIARMHADIEGLRAQARFSNGMLLFDALSGATRWLPSPQPLSAPLSSASSSPGVPDWITAVTSDGSLMAGRLIGRGSTDMLEQLGRGSLSVWDLRRGRPLWHRAREGNSQILWLRFSPDNKMLALSVWRPGASRVSTAIIVVDARTGKPLGAPLIEESPRQRFEESRSRWQQPLQNGARRITSALAQRSAPSLRTPNDGFHGFGWSPDSRFLVARYFSGQIKVWRVPQTQ